MASPGGGRFLPRWPAVLVALALLAAACTDDGDVVPEQTTSSTIPPAQTMLRVGIEAWPQCLNPITCDSPALREQVLRHVLPVAFEVDAAGEYRPSPLLAAEPDVDVDDGMVITYQLSGDARWDDGRPVTSSDLRGTWQAMVSTPGADTRGYDLITEVDDEDPLVAEVRLSEPYGDWKELFGGSRGWVLKADAFGPSTDLTGQFEDELPFAAAPYRLAAWDEGSAVLARVEDYWDPSRTTGVDQVRLIRVTVDELVEPGAFDLLIPARPDAGAAPNGFSTRTQATTSVLGVFFDQRTQLLGALAHRQALGALVDREDLIAATGADAEPIDCLGWLPEVGPFCSAAEAELIETDPALASYVLALEGWAADEAGDLVRGAEVFAVPVTYDPGVPGAEAVAEELQTAFESVGVNAVLGAVANRTWAEERPADRSTGVGVYELDLGISAQVEDLYGCPAGVASSVLAWCPESVVEPARALAGTVALEDQLELVEQIGAVAAEAMAWIPVVRQRTRSYVKSDGVEVPEAASAIGGPLATLHGFAVAD